jgi:hypothetical protein
MLGAGIEIVHLGEALVEQGGGLQLETALDQVTQLLPLLDDVLDQRELGVVAQNARVQLAHQRRRVPPGDGQLHAGLGFARPPLGPQSRTLTEPGRRPAQADGGVEEGVLSVGTPVDDRIDELVVAQAAHPQQWIPPRQGYLGLGLCLFEGVAAKSHLGAVLQRQLDRLTLAEGRRDRRAIREQHQGQSQRSAHWAAPLGRLKTASYAKPGRWAGASSAM